MWEVVDLGNEFVFLIGRLLLKGMDWSSAYNFYENDLKLSSLKALQQWIGVGGVNGQFKMPIRAGAITSCLCPNDDDQTPQNASPQPLLRRIVSNDLGMFAL